MESTKFAPKNNDACMMHVKMELREPDTVADSGHAAGLHKMRVEVLVRQALPPINQRVPKLQRDVAGK